MKQDKILRVISKIMIPFILVFALYVQFHGDYGPGGGFQAGVILAAGMIFYSLIFGLKIIQKIVTSTFLETLLAIGILLYGTVGLINIILHKNFLDYSSLNQDEVLAQEIGIFIVEIGVGITVFAVMLSIFYKFSDRRN